MKPYELLVLFFQVNGPKLFFFTGNAKTLSFDTCRKKSVHLIRQYCTKFQIHLFSAIDFIVKKKSSIEKDFLDNEDMYKTELLSFEYGRMRAEKKTLRN